MRRRGDLLLIGALAAILFLPALFGGHVPLFRDHTDYFQPLRWFTANELRAGRLPLWNPYNASGEPWLANPQTGVFYPPQYLFVALPFETAYVLFLVLHLALLGIGAYVLFARIANPGAALVGAVGLMFSGPALSLVDINNNLATFAWIPLVIFCGIEKRALAGAFALAMAFLGGEPFFAACAAVMFMLAARNVRVIAIAGVTAFGLTAVQLLPFLEWIRTSDRASGLSAAELFRDAMPLRDWMHVATFPRMNEAAFDPRLGQHFIPMIYVGIVMVVLALAGAITKRSWPWLALLVFAIAIGSGPQWLASLPVTLFRYPARMVPLGALAIAALAVLGIERLRITKRWMHLVLVLIVVADLVPRARPLLRTGEFRKGGIPYPRVVGADAKFMRVDDVPTHRERWISGYLNLYDRRFDAFTAAPVVDRDYLRAYESLLVAPSAAALREQSIGWLLTQQSLPRPFQYAARKGEVNLYRFPNALPLARFESGGGVHALALEIGTSRASMNADAATPGKVVLAQRDVPGWRVRVDGEIRKTGRKPAIFREIAVDAGRHRIEWTYWPATLSAGAVMTLVTLFTLFFSSFVKRARREKFFFLSHKF